MVPAAIDWIFFDCFNTLIDEHFPAADTSGLCQIPELAVQLGFYRDPSEFLAHYNVIRRGPDNVEIKLRDRLRYCLKQSTLSPAIPHDAALQSMLDHWHHSYRKIIRPAPGVQQMLARWHGRKKLAVVSNFFLDRYPRRFLQEFELDHFFEFIIDSADLGYRKPHRRIYEDALQSAGKNLSQAASVLFIGDRIDLDIDPPRALGMSVIHYRNPPTASPAHATPAGVPLITHWDQFI